MKWCAASDNSSVKNTTNVVVADAIPLCDNTVSRADNPDPVVGWCRGSISLSRLGATDPTPSCAWAIVLGRTASGGTLPLQIFNPFDRDDLERQDILGMGHIPVPAVTLTPSDDSPETSHESTVVDINIKVSRKLLRNTNNMFLWIVSSSANVELQAEVTVRTLMKF